MRVAADRKNVAVSGGSRGIGRAIAHLMLQESPKPVRQDAIARHAARRFGDPSDIAKAAAWLASDDSEFATGQTFVIDGGLTAASPLHQSLF